MRIIGNIEHPSLKISIFKMENRYSVKFENALYEQTFKLGDDERFASIANIEKWVDPILLEQVQQNFQNMHQTRMGGIDRHFKPSEETVFEEII
jgi:hypothetical protein